jgi:hypothetical protein
LIKIALEEYENLKLLPDQRQIALQRFQQQQRLNALIAQQQQLASAQATRLHQIAPDILQTLQSLNGQHVDYAKVIQHLYAMGIGLGTETTNNAANKRAQIPNSYPKTTSKLKKIKLMFFNQMILFILGGPVPILPRPTTTNITTINPNNVIVVESDEEPDDDATNTRPKQ